MGDPAVAIDVLESRALTWPEQATALTITDADSYAHAADQLLVIKELRKEIAETFGPIIKKAHEAHQEALGQRRKVEEPLEVAERTIKGTMGAWQREQERLQRIAQAEAEAEARRQEDERRQAEALALEEAGETAAAERVIEAPVFTPPPVVRSAAPAVSGIQVKKTWKAQLTDTMALVKAVAAGQVPLAILEVKQGALDAAARQWKSQLQWPGVRAYEDTGIAVRTAR